MMKLTFILSFFLDLENKGFVVGFDAPAPARRYHPGSGILANAEIGIIKKKKNMIDLACLVMLPLRIIVATI